MNQMAKIIQSRTLDQRVVADEDILRFERVCFAKQPVYGDRFRILDNLSFSVANDEFVAIVGPSGCGKTSTLLLAAGFDQPSNGKIRWLGEKREISQGPVMVFQKDTVFDWMTLEQNLGFVLQHSQSIRNPATVIDDILRLTGLATFRDFYPREVSGGMRKRIELGRAWITGRPLLLDEPMGQLDSLSRESMQQTLQHLWLEAPRPVLLVTHDLEESLILADRILVMDGPPGTIKKSISVPFPRPRATELRFDSHFQRMRRDLQQELIRRSEL
jgi:ABC-type nitrate/sulfonate/bicarbonate transport system ATPase subunit